MEELQAISDTAKRTLWRVITPVFPYVRDTLLYCGIFYHEGRQEYHVGWLREDREFNDFLDYLARKGFANHFVAWVDTDEVISLRKLVNFHWQYHLRVFSDGEVRGHYEKTPEGNPIAHFLEFGMEQRRGEFFGFLGDWVCHSRYPRRVARSSANMKKTRERVKSVLLGGK